MKFKKHQERVHAPVFPANIASLLNGYLFFVFVRNYPAPNIVYRAVRPGYPTLFVKVGTSLRPELERLSWLNGKLPIPRIVAYSTLEEQEYLLLTEVPGVPADDEKWSTNIAGLVEALADAVHLIHSLPTIACPFDASVEILMADAEKAARHKLIDSLDFSEAYRHKTINDLFDDLLQLRPAIERTVFTHGDLCLPNILIQQETSPSFVDWGLAGLSDPHRDLALIVRSIRSNLGEKWLQLFFDTYGQEVDIRRIEFFTLLDQFTMARHKQTQIECRREMVLY